MDELLHHCLRELSFDGDLGCGVSRLRDFIVGFYTHNHVSLGQTVDDAFYAFIWSIVVQNPTVCVGIIPPGAATEVYIAPQTSAKRKAKEKGEEHVDGPTPTLDILPGAKLRSLNDLKKEYGDNLRIAVDQETSFAAITGSHIRSSKLSPMVYTTLQLITRGRENGISVVDLGKKTGYDQKTCFYLVKQLVELGQIVKVRRGGVGTHFCIHKYFYERNPLWQQIRDEELQADLQNPSREYQSTVEDEHGGGENEPASIDFDPIDARHLSSLPLVRARVIKLLKGSKNYMHPCNNMLLTIGFSNPTKTDRRFFQSRIRDLIQQGIIEKVIVPNNKKKDLNSTIKCFRLVTSDGCQDGEEDVVVQVQSIGDEERDDGVLDDQSGIKANVTIHKQIVDLLEEMGTTGMTLSELSTALCHFDKRTIELLLSRTERVPPPSHLSDLGIVGLMETHGRERRNRYFTIASYRTLVTQENLDESAARYSNVNLKDSGGFAVIDHSIFYEDKKLLFKYQDEFKEQERAKTGGKTRKHPLKNPILPDGTVKQGRPKGSTKKRKPALGEAEGQPNTKRKRDDEPKRSRPAKKRRLDSGHSDIPAENGASTLVGFAIDPSENMDVASRHKVDFAVPKGGEVTKAEMFHPETRDYPPKKRPRTASGEVGQVPDPKKRGRPPKKRPDITGDVDAGKGDTETAGSHEGASVPLPRKRGRPPKQKLATSREVETEPAVDQLGGKGQPLHKKRPRVEKDTRELHSREAESTASRYLLLDNTPTGSSRRTTSVRTPELDVLHSETQHEGDGLAVHHESHRLLLTPQPPNDPSSMSQSEASSRSEFGRNLSEHQPKDVEHRNAGGDTSQDWLSQAKLSTTVFPSNVISDSFGLRAPRKGLITQGSLNSEYDNIQRRSDTSTTIDPSLTMEETNAPGASPGSRLHEIGPDISILPSLAGLTSRADHPFNGGVVSASKSHRPLTEQPEDQVNITTRPRVNVSNLRRENELLRVIEDLGGIVNYHTKEFFDAHSTLIQTMVKAGEPASAPPDVRLDKRTASMTLTNMENRGRVKTLKTSITTPTGLSRPACVVYLPNIAQDRINAFLGNLSCANTSVLPQPVKKIESRMEYGPDVGRIQHNSIPLQLLQMDRPGDDRRERRSRNAARADQLFSYDDVTIRNVLLTERTTLGQLYGFIVPKALRARELHLSMIDAFETGAVSLNIVSLQHRIIHLSYFFQDLTLSTYCTLVSALNYSEELTDFLATEAGPQTPVRDIPYNLYNTVLQVGRSRARSRLLDTMDILRSLKLVTPLQPSNSAAPLIMCAKNGEHPQAFEIASMEDWTVNTPVSAPVYWRFNTDVPLHLWVLSETSPAFWKDVSVFSRAATEAYWRELRETCTNRDCLQLNADSNVQTGIGPLEASTTAARSLRRAASWNDEYVLTWHQSQYLMRFVDISTGNTPLQNEAGLDAQMQKICWLISAPADAVANSFIKTHTKMVRELDRARRKKKRQPADDQAKHVTEAKILLLKKAAEARTQQEKDWEDIVHRVHAEPLQGPAAVRVRRVRTRFLQSSSVKDDQRWENEITEAVREATMPTAKALTVTKRPKSPQGIAPPPVTVNPPEKSIEYLIAQQGPPLPRQTSNRRKRTSHNQDSSQAEETPIETPHKALRRHRFQWNREYDELARDASAIIKARCRNGPRLDWAAFEQVFPAVPRNSVRQRLTHIRETPGNDAYLDRLEDRWYELWIQHRGTALLPDEDPQSLSNFSLIKHVEFLRMHIDKNALRVGFGQPKETADTNLSASVDLLLKDWDILESVRVTPGFDFMWSATVEEGREKSLLRQAITTNVDDLSLTTCSSSELGHVAESAVKMTFGTPHESYDSDAAARLLRDLGEQVVSTAAVTLINRGTLSKTVRDPQKPKPGRTLKISEVNQNAIGGSIPRDTFQDAVTLEDISSRQEGEWREWPVLATEGDITTLLQLVSDRKMEFRIDTSQPQRARPSLDWNSKKADDEQIETAIFVQFRDLLSPVQQPSRGESSPDLGDMELENESSLDHGKSVGSGLACCRRVSDGLVDCQACIENEFSNFTVSLKREDRELALQVLTNVRAAGSRGVTKNELHTKIHGSSESIYSIVRRMMDASVPLIFWAGYISVVLVSSLYLQAWTVITSETPRTRIFPRRWFDIAGLKMIDVWEAALKAVIGVVLFRPGISQAELRWRLRSVYDRQEVHDITYHLEQEGFIKSRRDPAIQPAAHTGVMMVLDDWEEKTTFWFTGDVRHWYQV